MQENAENRSDIRDKKRMLRQIQSHINQTAFNAGATCESVGFVDVIYHPEKSLPAWNYVTPRQKTAWVSASDIQEGMNILRAKKRAPRVVFNEALFPPRFAGNLLELGLVVERDMPIMIHEVGENPDAAPTTPNGLHFHTVTDSEGGGTWWYVWRSAYYNVITNTASPATIGMDLFQIAQGRQIDTILYRRSFPIGVSRVTLNPENQSAQIVGTAVIREELTQDLLQLIQRKAVAEAAARGCTLIFSDTQSELERSAYHENRFIDCGSVVCYAEKNDTQTQQEKKANDTVDQPVFTLR